ncbi:MAG: response regulator [Anaerolineae bacterium]|nr:response regulator [Anaerolineae bacterium]MDQ7034232.1 response regulator [Anaerolineae bacterium]
MSQIDSQSRILVVDDHIPAAEMVSRLFEVRGFETICAFSGAEALEQAQKHIPDLILLDVMMPDMDGYDVLEALRGNPATHKIPVIFITAKDDAADIEEGLRLGADDYIPKPVKPRELIARAKSKIEAYRLRENLEQKTTDLEALLRFSEALNNHLEVDELLDLILYLVLDLVPSHSAIIYHMSENKDIIETRVKSKDTHDEVDIDVDALKAYFSQHTDAVQWQSSTQTSFSSSDTGMAAGLRHGEQMHGMLLVLADKPFEENHLRLFENIGRQTTMALRNAELYAVKVNYAERLEEMVEERTAELGAAQELLVRAEKLASVGRLAAGIAHEINNPLMPIRVNLELMREDVEENREVSIQDIDETLRSVSRISRIVERLQQFTRKSGDKAPIMESLKIVDIVEDVISLSGSYIRNSGIKVDVNLHETAQIYGNRDQLEQVFLNIILNAHAAMQAGGTLTIDSTIEAQNLIVRFADTGTGIASDILGKIFEPFVSSKENGSGLGLFISYGIIENHNGQIHVESEVGKGTVFTLALPTIATT